ncbi:FKBP-type peptidyl-prolyl cis-trans isomerase [Klebsormidium nitens]|uniref:peptidylprolyl isomerase n=1 Tax=Klebsormidium nitens TaxID=105231 RepID=A0A1Y1HT65_KLENI|nr:FKBP-type peptidyl-prolyl cis-trans isomerase [Klebsormidium nitens]|eukprot:GAQ79746.1 FKBP-type peptidyl-prolyl cis-trans isomerase [Klebsormidium nitens]
MASLASRRACNCGTFLPRQPDSQHGINVTYPSFLLPAKTNSKWAQPACAASNESLAKRSQKRSSLVSCLHDRTSPGCSERFLKEHRLGGARESDTRKRSVARRATEDGDGASSEPLQVENGDTVTVHYRCMTSDGRLLHSSDAQEPLTFVSGAGDVVGNPLFQEFDQATRDLTVGEKGYVQAVGDEWTEDLVFDVPRDHEEVARLEASVEGTDEGPLKPGSVVQLINGNPAIVVAIDDEHVRIDANHPLAGSTLSFEVEVVNVEKARKTVTSTPS